MPGAMPRASSSSHIAARSRARFSACSAIGTRSVSPPRQKNGSGASSAAAEAAARAAKHATAWRRGGGAAAGAAAGLTAARWRAGAPRCANPGCATPRHARATRMAAKSGARQDASFTAQRALFAASTRRAQLCSAPDQHGHVAQAGALRGARVRVRAPPRCACAALSRRAAAGAPPALHATRTARRLPRGQRAGRRGRRGVLPSAFG